LATHDDPADASDERLEASSAFHQLLRCTRGDETRIYHLRVVEAGAELWRIDQRRGETLRSVKECHLHGPEEASAFLEEIRRTLTAGGWR
jgi:hypothetical protein